MYTKVVDNIKSNNLIEVGDTVVLGLSGGADSVALFHCLVGLREEMQLTIKAAHINHMIRDTAERDVEFVRNLCNEYSVEFNLYAVDVEEKAKEWKVCCEEAGRQIRYGFFAELAGADGKIATAHNANDNVETLLMRLMRGTGLSGLSGIPFRRGNIIRPLLNVSRVEIEKFMENYTHITDETNLVPIYTRNKIRLQLIPDMLKYNPNLIDTVNTSIVSFSEDNDYITSVVLKEYENVIKSNGVYSISLEVLNNLHNSIKKRLIMKIACDMQCSETPDLSSSMLDVLCNLDNSKSGKKYMLGKTRVAVVEGSTLVFSVESEVEVLDVSIELKEFDSATIKDTKITTVFCRSMSITNTPDVCYIPNSLYTRGNFVIRNAREGDIFRKDANSRKALNRFLTDKKIKDKKSVLVLADGSDVYWVLGVQGTRFSDRKGEFVKFTRG